MRLWFLIGGAAATPPPQASRRGSRRGLTQKIAAREVVLPPPLWGGWLLVWAGPSLWKPVVERKKLDWTAPKRPASFFLAKLAGWGLKEVSRLQGGHLRTAPTVVRVRPRGRSVIDGGAFFAPLVRPGFAVPPPLSVACGGWVRAFVGVGVAVPVGGLRPSPLGSSDLPAFVVENGVDNLSFSLRRNGSSGKKNRTGASSTPFRVMETLRVRQNSPAGGVKRCGLVGAGVLFGAGTIRLPKGRSGVSWGVQNRPGLLEGVRNACPNSIWNPKMCENLANPNVNLEWLAMCPSQKQEGKKGSKSRRLKNQWYGVAENLPASQHCTNGSELLSRGVAPIFSFFMSSMAPAVVGGIPMGGRLNGTPLRLPLW